MLADIGMLADVDLRRWKVGWVSICSRLESFFRMYFKCYICLMGSAKYCNEIFSLEELNSHTSWFRYR